MKTDLSGGIKTDPQNGKLPASEEGSMAETSEVYRKSTPLRKIAAVLIILICFFFLGKTLVNNLEQVRNFEWDLDLVPLAFSFLFLIVSLTISVLAWMKILLLFGIRLPFDQGFKIMFVSSPAKYVPGKIWLYLSQVYLAQKAKISKSVALFSTFLLFAGYSLGGLLVFVISLFLWHRFPPLLVSFGALVFLSLFSILFSSWFLNLVLRILKRISARFREGLIPEKLRASGRIGHIGQIILLLTADWVVFGVGVYFLVNSFYHITISQTIILCGIFAISVISGMVSFFVPAGLGVREGVQSYLLALFIPVSVAILISLVMRVWVALGELACFLLAWRIKKPEIW
jgi:uncharacterized membrane protein YbhN (UPF0104 family)